MAATVVTDQVATSIESHGFTIVSQALERPEVASLLTALQKTTDAVTETMRGGARALFERVPEIRVLALHESVRGAATAALGPDCFPEYAATNLHSGLEWLETAGVPRSHCELRQRAVDPVTHSPRPVRPATAAGESTTS